MNRLIEGNLGILAIDMHRGHLDPKVATLPLAPDKCNKIISNTKNFFNNIRKANIPIIHIVSVSRGKWEMMNNPYFRAKLEDPMATRHNVANHNIEGSPGTEIIPDLYSKEDHIVTNKKRFNCFYATDLEFLLRALKVRTVALTGVNTNSCVLCTAFDAHTKDFKVLMVKDCVDSMDGEDLHRYALAIFETALGRVTTSTELLQETNQKA
jgi:biuret amidohydrolase